MASFKLAKKDHLSNTRTNIYDLHESKMKYFETEKDKLSEYKKELEREHSEVLVSKIYDIENEVSLSEYLLNFFMILERNESEFSKGVNRGKLDTFIPSIVDNSKIEMYNEYIKTFELDLKEIPVNTKNENKCKNCKNNSFMFDTRTSSEVCTICGLTQDVILIDDTCVGTSYNETVEQVVVFNYKRNNHFQECLNQLQAKENTTIPQNIIRDLSLEFKKYNITDPKLLTASLVKTYLKKLKYNKYYEHIPTIINNFCGLPAPKMTPHLEQQLKIMFDEIQQPFEKYSKLICPLRKNFLNYNYIFYKMCQLLGKDEFLSFFPLLKSREKLYEHDQIWKGICQDLRWEYIPSI